MVHIVTLDPASHKRKDREIFIALFIIRNRKQRHIRRSTPFARTDRMTREE